MLNDVYDIMLVGMTCWKLETLETLKLIRSES